MDQQRRGKRGIFKMCSLRRYILLLRGLFSFTPVLKEISLTARKSRIFCKYDETQKT